MIAQSPTRRLGRSARACALAALICLGTRAFAAAVDLHQPPGNTHPVRPATAEHRPTVAAANRAVFKGQHLGQWMESHRALPLLEQQRALAQEPGFKNLPLPDQQRLHQRLEQLNSMSPEQRQRLIERLEAMERLAPAQRQQVRDAMAQLGSLPEYRRPIVSRTFYTLRDMPAEQRSNYMNSPQFRAQFNDQERGALNSLLEVAPIYTPLQGQPAAPRY